MYQKVKSYIQGLDQFGAIYKVNIQYNTAEYKTFFGGIISLLLYGTCFSYFLYCYVLWQTNQLLPKVTTTSQLLKSATFFEPGTIMAFQTRKLDHQSIDPFDPNNLVLQPVLYTFHNGYPTQKVQHLNYAEYNYNRSAGYMFVFGNVSFTQSSTYSTENPNVDYFVTFMPCFDTFKPNGTKCANNTVRDSYFAQHTNALRLQKHIKQFNTDLRDLEDIVYESYVLLDHKVGSYCQSDLFLQHTTVDEGILFESITSESFVSKLESTFQQVSKEYLQATFEAETYMVFVFHIGVLETLQAIQYPRFSEVLANAGSVISTLLLTSVLIVLLNQAFMENELVNAVIQIYYPEMKGITIKRNIFGRVIEVVTQQSMQVDIKYFEQYYRQLKQVALQKLTVINQLYEISRLQFVLQSQIQNNHHFESSHLIGIRLNREIFRKPQSETNALQKSHQILPNSSFVEQQEESELKPEQTTDQLKIAIPIDEVPPQGTPQLLKDEDFGLLLQKKEVSGNAQSVTDFFNKNLIRTK